MVTKKDMVIAVLATFSLAATIFMVIPTRSSTNPYDPWLDTNDDGKINIIDIAALATAFGTSGNPTKNVTVVPDSLVLLWIYSAPFIVSTEWSEHPSPVGLGPGVYETDILVHNPSIQVSVNIAKKVVEALPEPEQPDYKFFGNFNLLPDRAFRIDSTEILDVLGAPWPYFGVHKGFIGIISNSPYLDVVAVYTVSEIWAGKDMYFPGNTTSIETLTISPKPYYVYDVSP